MNYPITVEPIKVSRWEASEMENPPFGKFYSDHMFVAEYENGEWSDCKIVPFDNLSLSPATFALHYGQAIFEGMKAYAKADGTALLFRPEQNLKRMNKSAHRMGMPEIPESLFHDALQKLIALDSKWIPKVDGSSLYIRPFMFAADEFIGIRPTVRFKFIIITSPAGLYYSKPVKVLVSDEFVRAFPGGVGFAKASGNYGACMLPLVEAQKKGFDQVLWMDGVERKYVEEIGTMNVFFMIDGKLVTPDLDGTILDGVTRMSVIELAKANNIVVEERHLSIDEIISALKNNLVSDAFGTGTAASIAPISQLGYHDEVFVLPEIKDRTICHLLKKQMDDIKTGVVADKLGWTVAIKKQIPVNA